MTNETLSERLRHARKLSSLSQSELARRVGITPQAIQALESGASAGSKHLASIAGTLGVEPLWLAEGSGDMSRKHRVKIAQPPRVELQEGNAIPEWSEGGDGWTFPAAEIFFKAETVPVFVADPVETAHMPKAAIKHIQEDLFRWLLPSNSTIADDAKQIIWHICRQEFAFLTSRSPQDVIERPHYLSGQVEAYAMYLTQFTTIGDTNLKNSIIFISPHKRPDYGDLVVLWHKTNVFIYGRIASEDEEFIKLVSDELSRRFWDEQDMEKAFDMITNITFPKSELQSCHAIVGVEFSAPRSRPVRARRDKRDLLSDI